MPLQPDPIPPMPQFAEPNIVAGTGIGQVQALSPSDFLAANPRVPGTVAITVAGTITNNDPITVNVKAPYINGGVAVPVAVTALTGDSTATLAEKIAKAINDNAILDNFGVYADAVSNVVTLSCPGPMSAGLLLTTAVGGSATETLAMSPSNGIPTGGSGPVIPYQTFPYAFQGSIIEFRVGVPKLVSAALAAALVADGQQVY
jgi:hypothetical protein